jgi:hypothetical protein
MRPFNAARSRLGGSGPGSGPATRAGPGRGDRPGPDLADQAPVELADQAPVEIDKRRVQQHRVDAVEQAAMAAEDCPRVFDLVRALE